MNYYIDYKVIGGVFMGLGIALIFSREWIGLACIASGYIHTLEAGTINRFIERTFNSKESKS